MFQQDQIAIALTNANLLNEVYEILKKEDYGNTVMHVMNRLREMNLMPTIERQEKSGIKAELLRKKGHTLMQLKKYNTALQFYNLAILHAPYKSKCMQLAYDNRSALFFEITRYKACIKDIETALTMGFPPDEPPGPQLIERKRLSELKLEKEPKVKRFVQAACSKYVKVPEPVNKEIPSCSTAAKFEMRDAKRIMVADRVINVGEVISVEIPYQCHLTKDNQTFCCYCCLKYTENLIPCMYCCVAMYCSDSCREKNRREGHEIECDLMGLLINFTDSLHLSIKTVLKAYTQCNYWEDLMARVEKARADRDIKRGYFTNAYKQHQFDSFHYDSICFQGEHMKKWVPSEQIFNVTVRVAIVVDSLSTMLRLTVNTTNRDGILAFLGQQMVFHALESVNKRISSFVYASFDEDPDESKYTLPCKAIGHYAVAGQLRHSCNPNVEYIGFDDKLVLVATKKITPGCELITCYGETYWEQRGFCRQYRLYMLFNIECKCEACIGKWGDDDVFDKSITMEQIRLLRKLGLERDFKLYSIEQAVDSFSSLCKAMATFQNKPSSQYYCKYYRLFKECLVRFQYQMAPQQMGGIIMNARNIISALLLLDHDEDVYTASS